MFIATSLDGFIAREDGSLDWLPGSGEGQEVSAVGGGGDEDYGWAQFLHSVDTVCLGRKTYEKARGFPSWPYAGKRVVVLSSQFAGGPRTLDQEGVEGTSGSPRLVLDWLASTGSRHVYVDGGTTTQAFLRQGQVNSMTLTWIPVLIGSGRLLFGPLARDINLELASARSFPNGFVQTVYNLRT